MNSYTELLKRVIIGQQELTTDGIQLYMSGKYTTEKTICTKGMLENIISARERGRFEDRPDIINMSCINTEKKALLISLICNDVGLLKFTSFALYTYTQFFFVLV